MLPQQLLALQSAAAAAIADARLPEDGRDRTRVFLGVAFENMGDHALRFPLDAGGESRRMGRGEGLGAWPTANAIPGLTS